MRKILPLSTAGSAGVLVVDGLFFIGSGERISRGFPMSRQRRRPRQAIGLARRMREISLRPWLKEILPRGPGFPAVFFGGVNETQRDGVRLGSSGRVGEEPVVSAGHAGRDGAFALVVVDCQARVIEKPRPGGSSDSGHRALPGPRSSGARSGVFGAAAPRTRREHRSTSRLPLGRVQGPEFPLDPADRVAEPQPVPDGAVPIAPG
jgi:hypothetical protein